MALLHHANGFCAAAWGPVAQLLRPRYRVIAIDARGHGDSDGFENPDDVQWNHFVDDLVSVAEQVLGESGRDRIDYGIGSSLGGVITALAEARRPRTFKRIAMLDPPVHPGEAWIVKLQLDRPAVAFAREGLAARARKRRGRWPSRAAIREAWKNKPVFCAWAPEVFELYLDEGFKSLPDGSVALKCAPTVEAAVFEAIADIDFFGAFATVCCPILLVHASGGFFSSAIHKCFASEMPNGTYAVADVGHLIPYESPELCVRLLFDFVD